MGFWWLRQWQWGSILWEMISKQALGALPLFLFHCSPQLAMGRFHHLAFYIAPPLWCQSGTLFLGSPPLINKLIGEL